MDFGAPMFGTRYYVNTSGSKTEEAKERMLSPARWSKSSTPRATGLQEVENDTMVLVPFYWHWDIYTTSTSLQNYLFFLFREEVL